MITDEIRHEIAEEIRSKTLYTRGSLGDWWMRLHEAVTDEEDFPCPAETMAAIADLIDRPTCTFKPAYEPDVMGKVSLVECSKCGWTIEPWNAAGFNYCPNCGAEVVER